MSGMDLDDLAVKPPATDPAEVRRRHAANRAAWNQGAAWYRDANADRVAFLREGGSNLHPVERANLGDLRAWCRSAVHLQCASGQDTLSLLNEGVGRVVGIDIADAHIDNARATSAALGAPATWYRCDVLDTPHELDGSADLVYSGRGALNWLHDLDGWAAVVARLLAPGGILHLFDGHPFIWLLDPDATGYAFLGIGYFDHAEASTGWPDEYIGDLGIDEADIAEKHERLWNFADIFAALAGAGLQIRHLGEHAEGYWQEFPNLDESLRGQLPLTFSLVAARAGETTRWPGPAHGGSAASGT